MRIQVRQSTLRVASAALIGVVASFLTSRADAGFQFSTIDPPNSIATNPNAINNNGEVAGFFGISGGDVLGFLRRQDGTFDTFKVKTSKITDAQGVNDKDQITGYFLKNDDSCFFRKAVGKALFCGPLSQNFSEGTAINSHGVVTGFYQDSQSSEDHGFVWDSGNGSTTFDAPGAFDTVPEAMSDTDLVAGHWDDADGNVHGFIRDAGGTIAEFDVAGADITEAKGINDSGVVAGSFLSDRTHSFVRDSSGNITVFDPPGAITSAAAGINKKGVVVGEYSDGRGSGGFERLPNGKFKIFGVTGAKNTVPNAVNNNNVITGFYIDTNGVTHGFVGFFQ